MRGIRKINPLARAIGVFGVTAALVATVTFAATSNTATLEDNTIASATAELQIANVDELDECGTFGETADGFDFVGLIPGGAPSQTETFCLKNNGEADLAMKLFVPVAPTWTVIPGGTVDSGEVDVHINCASGAFTLDARLQDLISSAQSFSGGALGGGNTVTCTINVDMNAAAFSGQSASSSNFDFDFSGDAV